MEEIKIEMYLSCLPGVIENVMPAPLRRDIVLRGDMFGLKLLKQRKFELVNWFMMKPIIKRKEGSVKAGDFAQCVGKGQLTTTGGNTFKVPGKGIKQVWSIAMDIDWMTIPEMSEAIPPAYTRYIGFDFFRN